MKEFDELNDNEQVDFNINEANGTNEDFMVADFDKAEVDFTSELLNEADADNFEGEEDLDNIRLEEMYEYGGDVHGDESAKAKAEYKEEARSGQGTNQGYSLTNTFKYKKYSYDYSPTSDDMLEDIALYFALRDKEEIFFNSKEEMETAAYNEDVKRRQKEYLKDPFFVSFMKIDCTPDLICMYVDEIIRKNEEETGIAHTGNRVDAFAALRITYKDEKAAYEKSVANRTPMVSCSQDNKYLSLDSVMNMINNTIEVIETHVDKDEIFSASDKMQAVDYVLAKTLKTKAAKNALFESVKKPGTEEIDVEKLNEKIEKMRDELLNDPKFSEVLNKRLGRGDLYSEYKDVVHADIQKKIANEKRVSKKRKTDAKYKEFAEDYMYDKKISVDYKDYDTIKTQYDELVVANKDKKPSDYMKKLIETCQAFMAAYDEGDGVVNASVVDAFNKACLKYYDKRQGVISGPATGKGQARLEIAANIIDVTSNIMKPVKAEMNKAYEAEQKKMKAM